MKPLNRSISAFGRLGCFGLLLFIVCLWGGGQGLYTAFRNPKPVSITVAEYEKQKPKAEWVEFKNAYLVVSEAAFSKSRITKELREVYMPLRSTPSGGGKISVLLETTNPDIVEFVSDLNQVSDSKQAAEFMTKNSAKVARFSQSRDVSGLIQFGIELDDSKRRKLLALSNGMLANDFVLLSDGKKPEIVTSIAILAFALLVGFALFRSKKA